MQLLAADVLKEYEKNKELRREDVSGLQEWAKKQPHLPPITELQLILFLHSCYFKLELAKATIDIFYTARTHCPDFFTNRDPFLLGEHLDLSVYVPLPKPAANNYRVIYSKLINPDASQFVFAEQIKVFDMVTMLWLMEEGTSPGIVIVYDMECVKFAHLTRLGVLNIKKLFYYLQEALPVRLLGLHFINAVSFMDKVMALMKPFIKKELMDVLDIHTHPNDSLFKHVPRECLPKDLGGTEDSVNELQERMIKKLQDHAEYFKAEEELLVDESKRPGKPKNAGDIFGVEGSFKKLDID